MFCLCLNTCRLFFFDKIPECCSPRGTVSMLTCFWSPHITTLKNQKELWELWSCESHWVCIWCPFGSMMEHHKEHLLLYFISWGSLIAFSYDTPHSCPFLLWIRWPWQLRPLPCRAVFYLYYMLQDMLVALGPLNWTEIACFRLLITWTVGLESCNDVILTFVDPIYWMSHKSTCSRLISHAFSLLMIPWLTAGQMVPCLFW